MEALATVAAFVALTAIFVALHLRRRGGTREPAPVSCPRCAHRMPEGLEFCPACGVPMQAFELVRAPVVTETAEPPESGPLHAVVRADRCVGCGTCVAACPEPGAIRLVDHVALVDLGLCKGHAQCASACPVGAIVVTSGAASQRIEVPEIDANFQSNVPGLYVVGELGGRGLIKNAINEGKIAAEHIAAELGVRRGERPALGTATAAAPLGNGRPLDVVIVGSGPAGISAGLCAIASGLRCLVLEQGNLADSIRRYPRRKLLLAEPLRVPLYGDLWIADGSKEVLLEVWQGAIVRSGLEVVTDQRVEAVARDGNAFVIRTADREYRAARVVLALGRRGTPRRLGVPGEGRDQVYYDIIEMEAFEGWKVLVVGGGDSAVESAIGLANQRGTDVTLSYRGARFERVKPRNLTKLDDAVARHRVTLRLESRVREIRDREVVLEWGDRTETVPNDAVVVRIGGEAPYPFLERAGVRIVRKEIAAPETSRAAAGGM